MEFMVFLTLLPLLLTARATAATPVVDVDGEPLQRGVPYHVQSVIRPGGGLKLASLKESCPLFVALTHFPDLSGRPVAFFPENQDDDTVQEGYTLNIMFPEPTACTESTMWQYDTQTTYVATGGRTSASIGPQNSRFAFRKVEDSSAAYQIEFCPCSMGVSRPSCRMGCVGSLGRAQEGNNILLSINSNRPHVVNFVKVKQQEDSMIRL